MAYLDEETLQKFESIFDEVHNGVASTDDVCVSGTEVLSISTDGTMKVDMVSGEIRIKDFDYIMISKPSDVTTGKLYKILFLVQNFQTSMFKLGQAYTSLTSN